jgi:predicted RNA-binding protein with PIN domain
VFCARGAGYVVAWNRVPEMAHTQSAWRPRREEASAAAPRPVPTGGGAQDKELQAIFERTYGPVKERREAQVREARREPSERIRIPRQKNGPEYLLADGYNLIFAWEDLKTVALENLDAARKILCDSLCDYQSMRGCAVIVVFDAYKVKGNPGSHELYNNIHVIYTKEAETADAYIERATYELAKENRVRVATSDGPEQMIILGHGALRVSASMFREEMEAAKVRIAELIAKNNRAAPVGAVRAAMEAAQKRKRS